MFVETDADREAMERIPISVREERKIGGDALRGFLTSLKQRRVRATQRGRDARYVHDLLALVRPRMENANRYPTLCVYVAKTRDVDARAFPGGSIVVTTGLLDFAHSEAALVGILGHELSHIDHGHQLRTSRALKLAQQGWSGFKTGQDMQTNIRAMASNFARPYRPEDEAVADGDGAEWAYDLGYDPREMAELFRRLEGIHPQASSVPSFLRTHPYNAQRYAAINSHFESRARTETRRTLYVGVKNLQERVPRDERRFPE
jgi:predicted Zn-dependent protease